MDNDSDGTLELDWELAEESPDLTGAVIAPHSFYLIGESGVAGGADLTVNMDLATGEGGASERAIGIQLIIDGVHQDHLLYGRDDGSSPSGDVPAGDLDPFGSYPRAEVTRNTLGGTSFAEGVLQRLSVADLYAGYDVEGYYTDEASLGDGNPVGVWSSPHDREDGSSYTPRNAASVSVLPPCAADIDCDDSNSTVGPSAPEICDGIDNNCDGLLGDGEAATREWPSNNPPMPPTIQAVYARKLKNRQRDHLRHQVDNRRNDR